MDDLTRLTELIEKGEDQEHIDRYFATLPELKRMPRGSEYLARYLLNNGVTFKDKEEK